MDLIGRLRRPMLAACLLWLGAAQAGITDATPLPASAWGLLEATPGIRVGGDPGHKASVQVVCDANCPYCAKLQRTLPRDYPGLAVRWVFVAYFKPESAALAAAILASPDPAASLAANYRGYDFTTRRGGYRPRAGRPLGLSPAHSALKQQWLKWGGSTPMVLVRTKDGRIVQAQGSTAPFLRAALDQAAPAVGGLKAWQPNSSKRGRQ